MVETNETKIPDTGIDLSKTLDQNDLNAYETYVKLTAYENIFLDNTNLRRIIEEYSSRDETFPVDFAVGA